MNPIFPLRLVSAVDSERFHLMLGRETPSSKRLKFLGMAVLAHHLFSDKLHLQLVNGDGMKYSEIESIQMI
jgi:hypothetical protein